MNVTAYEFDINHATDAGTLHEYRANVAAEDLLTAEEKAALNDQIDRRFSWLNQQAAKPAKPRW